jgi:DNA-binding GntR family transcriptional regulator
MQEPRDADRSVTAEIARALAERIVTGALAPGERIRQDQVAAEFGASHVPVREAFRKLEAQGLAVGEPRRGVRVAPLDPSAVLEVTEMRAALEAVALRYALPRLSAHDLSAAAAALAEADTSRDIMLWEAANRRFHSALTAPCAMPRLIASIDDLHRVAARFLFATWKELEWKPRSDDEHRRILAAVRKGDAERATALLSNHILAAGKALSAMLESKSAARVAGQTLARAR